ncbi:helix-turn-helix transcriptional regulator [uncultured Psychromonas sp.]|uniref:XRE family transcriptional regulator n=1 Tax=uncultured Psychromonas sp. TaxID=173974 RepID=UPI0026295B4B|nr:helix-turn-helix transcriptional regulator [uncultured Psychromonas sp.]
MKTLLNIEQIKSSMALAGLTQTAISEHLDVTREAVSQWLNAKAFPRPNKLLKLAKLLKLSFSELTIIEEIDEPRIAFRKAGNYKTKPEHIEKAKDMGRYLRPLVEFLPFDCLETPTVFQAPNCEYDYLHKATDKVRNDIGLEENEIVGFNHLITRFKNLQAVIVPVLWGAKKRHENAVHIHLPDSNTTWIYLNLDVNIHDFKFWMAHELGHCLSPSLSGDEAENFADAFAGVLLFPYEKAKNAYDELSIKTTIKSKLSYLMELAKKEVVSPATIQLQINNYARHHGYSEIDFSRQLYAWITNFNRGYKNVSEMFFKDLDNVDAKEFIEKTESNFETPFFDAVRQCLKKDDKGIGYIQMITDMPLLDAREIYSELN